MNTTQVINRLYFKSRQKAIANYATQSERIQRIVLRRLLHKAEKTEWGKAHDYKDIETYEQFVSNVPVNTYEELKNYIQRMREGESDVLWKGNVRWYAKSSGTTNDKSKFIPVSLDGLKKIHYLGGRDSVSCYLAMNPKSNILRGKSLILGGSHAPNLNTPKSLVGDLSAILIENVPKAVNLTRVPNKKIALMSDFEQKRDQIARAALNMNITNISGVPSWMLSVLNRVLELSGKQNLSDIWPNLEVFFHGGVAFTPYREQYKKLIPSDKMHYMETYNASEGFFGIQNDPNDTSMLLMIDYDVFYEFCPMEDLGEDGYPLPDAKIVPLWNVEIGKNYAMIISTSCGLWRYMIGDTVKFTQKNPYKFVITGRTKHFINAFGEELIVDNAEKGLLQACVATGAQVQEYTAAPIFMDADAKCRHQWIIEFRKAPGNLEEFALILDRSLQAINSDYEAKRYKNVTLQPLEIIPARKGLFDDWLRSKGKLGGQHKIPRLSNTRQYINELLEMNKSESAGS